MPKSQNSFENALTIVNNTRQLSPRARQMLQEGNARGSGGMQTFFEDTYFRDEYRRLPPEEAKTVSEDLHIVLDILKPLLELLDESRIQGAYPKYARAILLVLEKVYQKLGSWGCFEGWGTQVEFRDIPHSLLPLAQTDAAIRQCANLIECISKGANKGVLSLVDLVKLYRVDPQVFRVNGKLQPQKDRFDYLYFFRDTEPPRRGLLPWGRRNQTDTVYLSRIIFTDDNFVNIENWSFIKYRGYSQASNKYRVTLNDMVLLVSGLLDDALIYSKCTKEEIAAGQTVAENIRILSELTRHKP